jgi:thiol-disulfide isomerase/thioredoxin
VVAASEKTEEAGSLEYHDNHMGAIFKAGFSFSGYERDLVSLNLGDGTFVNISGVTGADHISDGRGSVFADFDNDGDTDIFLTTAQREAHFLFRNNVGNDNAWVRVTLEGADSGRDAYGAVVRVKSSAGTQAKVKSGGHGFLSHGDGRLLFGLGEDASAEWIEIVWPGGARQRIDNVPARSSILVVEGAEGFTPVAERRFDLVDPLTPEQAILAGLGFGKGEVFPDLSLRSSAGESLAITDLIRPGRKTLVNLWATWCVPCAREMPELEKLAPELTRAGIDLVGVSVDLDTVGKVGDYVASRGITYPIYTTDEAAMEALYPRGEATVPLTVLLDDAGRVLHVYSGWSKRSEQAVHALTE